MITVQYIVTLIWGSQGSQFYLQNPFWSHLFLNILFSYEHKCYKRHSVIMEIVFEQVLVSLYQS